MFEDYSEVIEELLVEMLGALIGGFAVSGDTYYLEYEQRLFRWKTGTTEWVDTGLINESELTIDMIDSANTPDSFPSNLAVSGSTVYVGKWNGRLFQSFDEGNTWNDVTARLPFPVCAFQGRNLADHRLCRDDKGVVYSNDALTGTATQIQNGGLSL